MMLNTKSFTQEIPLSPVRANCFTSGAITLATQDSGSYINLMRSGSSTIDAADWRKLRDILNEVYPSVVNVQIKEVKVRDHAAETAAYMLGIDHGKIMASAATPAKPAQPRWETVADGMDRLKVPGGWIYQSDKGVQTFVPETK